MPVISQIEDCIIAPRTLPTLDTVPLSTVSVLSPGFIRVPQKECTPIDCWAEDCEKYYEPDWFREPEFDTDAQPEDLDEQENIEAADIDDDLVDLEATIEIAHTVEFTKGADEASAWEVDSATSTTMSVTTIDSPHVTSIHRYNPYNPFHPKHELFRCPCNGCSATREQSYNYGPMESHPSWTNTQTPQPESQSGTFMVPTHPEQYNVSLPQEASTEHTQQQQSQWNDQQPEGQPEQHPFPQGEVARQYMEPAEPMKFVPPPPPPVAAYEIFLDQYDSCYKDDIDTYDEQQAEEKKQRCRSYGLHLQYRSAMRWYECLERCQLLFVPKEDPCPVPTPEVPDSPACFLEWNRAVHQWWMRWFEHAQKKCSPLGIGAMKRSNRSGAFATHRSETQGKDDAQGARDSKQRGYGYNSRYQGKSTAFRAQRAAVSASLASETGGRRPFGKSSLYDRQE